MSHEDERRTLIDLFRKYGVAGRIAEVTPRAPDEAVFVVSAEGAAAMQEGPLTAALQTLLHRKVWVVTDGPQWEGATRVIDTREGSSS